MNIVRFVGKNGCSDRDYLSLVADGADSLVVDTLPADANVRIRFSLDGKPVNIPLTPLARDFLDLTILAYIVDETVSRKTAPDQWSRSFDVLFPVANPDRFNAVSLELTAMLRFLTGDDYSFTFVKRKSIEGLGNHRRRLPERFSSVCLFSGGIDSLLGAYRLLQEEGQTLLVGHQADGVAAAAQTQLSSQLKRLFPDQSAYLQARVARASGGSQRFRLPEKDEDSHRVRSLLFLGLAVCVANTLKMEDVFIPENGLIALNVPLGPSRLGSLSTRTAHPSFLLAFQSLCSSLGVYGGAIRNPFVFESKTDLLIRTKGDSALRPLLRRSVSCARPSRYQDRGVRHCGYCVPCIYRRAAMRGAGIDRSKDYAFDVFSELERLSAIKQTDFRSLVRFALKAASGTKMDLDRFVISHGTFDPAVAGKLADADIKDYSPWREMLKRWAIDFLRVTSRLCPRDTKAVLGLSSSRRVML